MKMKLLKSMRVLLVAAGLCVGASNAWADDYYNVTRYSQDYEDETTYTSGWSLTSSYSQGTKDTNHYLSFSAGNGKELTNTLDFSTNAYFSGAVDYEFAFDFGFGSGNSYAKGSCLTVKGKNGVELFTFRNKPGDGNNNGAWPSTQTYIIVGTDTLGTFVATYKTLPYPFLNFIIRANSSDGVVLSVINNGTKIVNSVKIAQFTTIESISLLVTGGASVYGLDNMIMKEHSDVAVAEDPTFAFASVSGDNRVYTISNPNGEGTLFYTTATADVAPAVGDAAYSSTTENSIDVPFGTGTYYAYAVLADGTTTSAVVSQAVTGGAITLVKPYFSVVSYNESTAKTTITLNTNVSGLLGTPTATLKYTIDEGAEQSTTNGGSVEVADGSTISFYAEADGYTSSEITKVTATAPNTYPQLWRETYNGVVSSDKNFSLGNKAISVNGTDYYYLTYDEGTLFSERLVANNVYSNNMLRSSGYYSGQTATLAILNLKKGDYITLTGSYGNGDFKVSGNSTDLTADAWHTIVGNTYTFTVKADGTARFTLDRYGYLKTITIQRAIATPGATVGSTGYATFAADVALDLSTLTEGFTAFVATDVTKGSVTMTSTTDKVPAGTGLFIKGSGAFTITETRDDTTEPATNYLVGVTENGTVTASTDGTYHYVYAVQDGVATFYNVASDADITAGKAYLETSTDIKPTSGARVAIIFDGEATGITSVLDTDTTVKGYYNLSGQRISQPTKGLYIVNGKKVIK